MLDIQMKRRKKTIIWRKNMIKSNIKSNILNLSRSKHLEIYQMMLCVLLTGLLHKYQDNKQIEKELEWYMIDDADSVNLVATDYESYIE